jgi:hypothetical protein
MQDNSAAKKLHEKRNEATRDALCAGRPARNVSRVAGLRARIGNRGRVFVWVDGGHAVEFLQAEGGVLELGVEFQRLLVLQTGQFLAAEAFVDGADVEVNLGLAQHRLHLGDAGLDLPVAGEHQAVVDPARGAVAVTFDAVSVRALGLNGVAGQLIGETEVAVADGGLVRHLDVALPGFDRLGVVFRRRVEHAQAVERAVVLVVHLQRVLVLHDGGLNVVLRLVQLAGGVPSVRADLGFLDLVELTLRVRRDERGLFGADGADPRVLLLAAEKQVEDAPVQADQHDRGYEVARK